MIGTNEKDNTYEKLHDIGWVVLNGAKAAPSDGVTVVELDPQKCRWPWPFRTAVPIPCDPFRCTQMVHVRKITATAHSTSDSRWDHLNWAYVLRGKKPWYWSTQHEALHVVYKLREYIAMTSFMEKEYGLQNTRTSMSINGMFYRFESPAAVPLRLDSARKKEAGIRTVHLCDSVE